MALFCAFALSFILSFSSIASAQKSDWKKEAQIFSEVMELIDRYYLYSIDLTKCRQSLLKHLNPYFKDNTGIQKDKKSDPDEKRFPCLDKYSGYMTPEEATRFQIENKGHFAGIGVAIHGDKEGIIVAEVKKNGPAQKAGIQEKDKIIAIKQDNEKESFLVNQATISDIVDRIRGMNGTAVFLTIERDGKKLEPIKIIRGDVKIDTVIKKELLDGMGYVQIKSFNEETGDDMEDAFREFQKTKHDKGVIIDVRHNSGGLVDAAQEILYLLTKNQEAITVTERSRKGETVHRIKNLYGLFTYRGAKSFKFSGDFSDIPIVILINGVSASASEILAGTLQDWGRASLVGEKSFGKGVGQAVLPLSDGSKFRLTYFEFLVGNGQKRIHEVGAKPGHEVLWQKKPDQKDEEFFEEYNKAFGDPEKDPQLKKAIELLRAQ